MIFLANLNRPNASQLEKMQQEAYDRVNEMHRRSQAIVQGEPPPPPPENPPPPSKPSFSPQSQNPFQDFFKNIFPHGENVGNLASMWDFKIDEEKALIGIIIYILAKNKADPKLIIGLGYLLL